MIPQNSSEENSVNCVNSITKEWKPIVPLLSYSLPTFPTDVFPAWLRDFVEAVAENTQTPSDLPAMLVLAACALCVAGKARTVLPGWEEPLCLNTVTALPPGSRKSAVFSTVMAPFTEWEREQNAGIGLAILEAETKRDLLKARLEHTKRKATTGQDIGQRLDAESDLHALARELDAHKIPVPVRLLTDDCTPERLVGLLAEQGGRIGLFSPEGDVFQQMAGRYSDKPNLGVYLKGHAGDELRVDRQGRPSEYVAAPCLTIGLTVQPEALRGLIRNQEFRGRGLVARFLFALPANNLGFRDTNTSSRPIPPEVTAVYREGIRRLLQLEPEKPADEATCPHRMTLSPQATQMFEAHHANLEVLLRPGEILGGMTDWGGKLLGALARIAGILHLAETSDPSRPISADTLERALCLQDYLISHARAAYAQIGTDETTVGACILLDWIRRTACPRFTKRDAHYALQGRFPKAADLDASLSLLSDSNYIQQVATEERAGPGRRPSPVYEVNPALTQLTQLTEFVEPTDDTASEVVLRLVEGEAETWEF